MRVLVDTDVILDFRLERQPFFQAASDLLELNAKGSLAAYISSITPINAFYIGRKVVGDSKIRQGIDDLLRLVSVTVVDQATLSQALGLPFADYEDAVQHQSALAAGLDAIVTRNTRDYKNATLPIFTSAEFLNHLKSQPS